MRILHTGDWHIGNHPGPEKNGENVRFLDLCRCLDALVEIATEESPDLIVVAGDIFHQAKVWSDRGLRENRTATHYIRLLKKVAPVVIVRGTPNHDSEQQFELLKNTFDVDGDVRIITEPKVDRIFTGRCGWVQIAGLPGFDRGFYRAKHPGLSKEEENEVFTEELERIILGLKAQCDEASPTVFVSHYTIPGCNMESGQTQFFAQFEPVIYPATLMAANFTLNCFGHIHRPQHIEEAGNTYYCGAISALNFNDEAQERGFYIHDIEDDIVKSTFYPLPTRQYVTLRFTDTDITAIVLGSLDDIAYNWWRYNDGVRGAIVRVIYDCTDEHNKVFNKALLEKTLYDDGAFWVQEITPQKISITVNRDELADDDSPEEHLARYFADKEYKPERIAEIIDAARPIIAEATETTKGRVKTGVFTPVRIEVKNYRNYREEVFDYDGIRFCTINGENGAGKSSLFMDAMLDALYEEPREGDLTGWICNDPDVRSGSIQFTFSIGEAKYRVTRTRQKSGKATLNIAEEIYGEWQDRSAEKYRDTQAIITETIGMDSLTFKACALIMQDQYGLFLQADKEARMNILGNILGLGIYDTMEDIAADRLTDINRQIRIINEKVTDITAKLPDAAELANSIEATKTLLKEMQEGVEKAVSEIDSTKVRLNTKIEATQRVIRIIGKLHVIANKKLAATTNKTSQSLIINGATVALSEEQAIKDGVAEYEALLEKEKSLISTRDRRNDLAKRKSELTAEVFDLDIQLGKATEQRDTTTEKIGTLANELAEEEALKAKHKEYLSVTAAIEELQKAADESAGLQTLLMEAEKRLATVKNEVGTETTRKAEEIEGLKRRVSLLENSGCPDVEKASCKFLADAIAAKAALPEKEASAKEYEAEASRRLAEAQETVDLARNNLAANKYTPEEMARLRADLTALQRYEEKYRSLDRYKEQKEYLEKRLEELEQTVASLTERLKTAEAERDKISDQLDEASKAAEGYDLLSVQIKNARVWVEKEKELPAARERLAAATARVEDLNAEIEQLEAERKDLEAELLTEKTAAEGASELESIVKKAEREIYEKREAINQTSMKLGALQKQEEDAAADRAKIKELQEQAEGLGKLASTYDDLKKAFSQDGIPHNVIRSLIPLFEATATGILGQMSGGKMSVEFVTEKVLKSNSKKEVTTLDIVINDCNTGRLPYMSRSGGERVKAALSVILALSEIKSSKAGVQLGFLFIDEPPFLDAQGVQAYCDALEAIQSRYSSLKIMAITHDPTMKSRFPQSVDVIKTEKGSKVIYE